ncbi:MAG TPA: hypothetical protein VMW87_12850 [Spirochaetia bacterium]|nr:hypothetical protein [Spirochaetia bacterium]
MTDTFPLLLLIGRPAAGKSEVIRFLRSLPDEERSRDCHVGPFREIDDFPMIWAWFEEDDILARHGRTRLHTDKDGYFTDHFLWHLLIERLELEYWKLRKDDSDEQTTAIVEFARGTEHGGLRDAFSHLTERFLSRAVVLYINVSYEESLRKNRRRFNPDKPHSILEHALPDEKLDRLYRGSDWAELSAADPAYLQVGNVRVPYAVFENEDDVTTAGGHALGDRLKATTALLWQRWQQRPSGAPPANDRHRTADSPVSAEPEAGALPEAGAFPANASDFRITAADESHFVAHAREMLLGRDEVEAIVRQVIADGPRSGVVRNAVRHSRPVGYSGLKRVSLRDRASFWAPRPERSIPSHLVVSERRKTRWLCFWGRWIDSTTFLLETFYPGKPAPREIHDPAATAADLRQAVPFWATHAIITDTPPARA